ncbi:MFS transporter [Streptomyces sp. TRM43335]|uniref:MFS transporter n=2 Tax=Streptomyces taklimakanensis TaxID=2569853 RepID=A0A6G2BAE9_9ACTN|nr:MFS transporter [Streptomyces taklimakanensis]
MGGGILIVASRAPAARPGHGGTAERPVRAGWAAPYARLLASPDTRAFLLAGLLARLPAGMFSISAILMITAVHGSYALAGAVTAVGLAATAVVAPLTARLVDRYGQSRVTVPAAAVSVAGSLTLVLCVRYGAPLWTLFAAQLATATAPNVGGMSRARWAHLHPGPSAAATAARHTANSLEQALDEVCFVLGPVLATVLCTSLAPQAGTLTAASLLLVGALFFACLRRTEPPVAPRDGSAPSAAPLRVPGMPPLLTAFLATGAVFGALEVVTVAYADALGHRSAAGAVLALQALGSGAAGLAFGALRPTGQVGRRFAGCAGAMAALMLLPLLAAGARSLPVLAPALLVAGMATAPAMVTGMTLVQRLTPPDRLNEGMTLAVTALLGGIATGSAVGGWVVEHLGAVWGYAVPPAAAALAATVAVAGAAAAARPRT